jgi:DNA-binding GntR family transcriptional regulator
MGEKYTVESMTDELRGRILHRDFGTNGPIPKVSELARGWGTSRTTVYQVVQMLLSEGLLIPKGTGYNVNFPMRIPGITPTFDKYLVEQGLPPKQENIIEPELIQMPDEIAAMFKQPKGVHVVHRMRRQGTVDIPYRLAENWYPASLAAEFVDAMRRDSNLDVLSEIKRVHGVYITQVHEDVIGRLPTAKEASDLSIVRTAPVLEVRRSNFAADGTPIMFNKIIFVGAYFLLSYDYPANHWSA